MDNIETGFYSYEEIASFLEKNYKGDGFEDEYEHRLDELYECIEEEGLKINLVSSMIAKKLSARKICRPSIFLVGNGNIRFVYDDDKKSVGIQIQNERMQVVVTHKR